MIGPVQLFMIGFKAETEIPPEVWHQIDALQSNPAVQLIGVHMYEKDRRGMISDQQVNISVRGRSTHETDFIDRLTTKAGAARTMTSTATSGRGFLMSGDPIPDIRGHIAEGVKVIVLLLEHRWVSPLRDAVRENKGFPVTDAWIGREAVEYVGLDAMRA